MLKTLKDLFLLQNHNKPKQSYFETKPIEITHKQELCFYIPDFLWELCIGDQETGDVVAMEEANEGVDFRIHDWLTHQGEGAVLHCQTFLIALRLHSRDT